MHSMSNSVLLSVWEPLYSWFLEGEEERKKRKKHKLIFKARARFLAASFIDTYESEGAGT